MLPEPQRTKILSEFSEGELASLEYDWTFWGRQNQQTPDGDWLTWLILAGRGFGKTRTGAEWVKQQVDAGVKRIAIIGETQKDLEQTMVEGESGILSVFPEHERPKYTKKPVVLQWPNGAVALGYNGREPEQLRGPQFEAAWADELAKYRYAGALWDQLQFSLRLGDRPRVLVTTTPRPTPTMKAAIKDTTTHITRGSTMDNAANLAETFIKKIHDKYAGTRLGRQELEAELLEDIPGALWTLDVIDKCKVDKIPDMQRIVVAIDPSGADDDSEKADEIGIVVAGKGVDGRGYVLADRTCSTGPAGWGRRAVSAYHEFLADRIVAERNFGGAMVKHVIYTTDKDVPYKEVTASRGKVVRAEPVAALYEQGKISHLNNDDELEQLEDQMTNMTASGYVGENSPDRLDALVWALTEVMLSTEPKTTTGTVIGLY